MSARGRVTGVALAVTGVACWLAAAAAAAPHPRIDVQPSGLNGTAFSLGQHDYVSRCEPHRTRVVVSAAKGWRAAIGNRELASGRLSRKIAARPGKRTRVTLQRRGSDRLRSYDLRCLPSDFPEFTFDRQAPGGPRWFTIQMGAEYAALFDRAGVPIWWYKASGEPDNFQLLRDGTIAFDPVDQLTFQTGDYEIRSLSGRLIRVIRGAKGTAADIHEIQLLDNGNYLIGAQDQYAADTSPYGGSADSQVIGIEIQEIRPDGKLVWKWDSRKHIDLGETGRWWAESALDATPYDIVHWNSAQVDGRFIYLSFRHLDAVYKVNRRTGKIVWKLGGTPTPQSLDVTGDPHGSYPLGGQHDARVLPDGTLTVHDNRTLLGSESPRVVRYRIDQAAQRAKLVQSFAEPEVPASICCGSASRLDSKDWLVNWGGNGFVGGYGPDGSRLFDPRLASGFSYRANPVPEGVFSRRDLRRGMDRIAKRAKAG